jgi:hypothetical protein
MKDRNYAEQLDEYIGSKLDAYSKVCDEVYESIYQRLSYHDSKH